MEKTKSIGLRTEWLFSLAFYAFLLISALVYIYVFQTDLDHSRRQAFQDNQNRLRQLESRIESRMRQLQTDLIQAMKFKNESELLAFRQNYRSINHELHRKWLSPAEFNLYKTQKILPLLQIESYDFLPHEYQRFAESMRCVFDLGCKTAPIMDSVFTWTKPDLEILKQIGDLKISLQIEPFNQSIGLSRQDFDRLEILDGRKDGIFSQADFLKTINPELMRFGITAFMKIPFQKTGESYLQSDQDLDAREIPSLWLISYIFRKLSRLGMANHMYSEFADNTFKFADLSMGHNQFFKASSTHSSFLFSWESFPLNFEQIPEDKVLLFPRQVFIASIDQIRIARSLLYGELKQAAPEFGVEIQYADGEFLNFNREGQQMYRNLVEARQHGLRVYSSTENQFLVPAASLKAWQEFEKTSFERTELPQHYMLTRKNGTEYFASSFFSFPLGNARVLIYQKKQEFLLWFSLRFGFLFCFFPLALWFYYGPLRKKRQELLRGLEFCVQSFVGRHAEAQSIPLPLELQSLIRSMQGFDQKIEEKNLDLRLNLGLQKILNTPHQSFEESLREFYYLAHSLDEKLAFRILPPGQLPEGGLILGFQRINQPPLRLHFEKASGFSVQGIAIIEKSIRDLIEKVRLEESEIDAQKIRLDLELGQRLQDSLVSRISPSLHQKLELVYGAERKGLSAATFFDSFEFDSEVHLYLGEINQKGIASNLMAAHLRAFFEARIEKGSRPEEILWEANRTFCLQNQDNSTFVSLLYLKLDLHLRRYIYVSAGHVPFVVLSPSSVRPFRSQDVPLGLLEDWQFKPVEIEGNGILYCFNHGLLEILQPGRIHTGFQKLLLTLGRFQKTEVWHLHQQMHQMASDATEGEFAHLALRLP